ncbi:hypothetical protein SCHPADRAFT_947066 [Schizopora paradoxa]|uniref:Uncharacterized protein n=1 Tax=Schizopora paradoxa TaxID=27342 RepID=A0A0H2R1Q7_9AGAM|nr:hypothetical protein SCHPADRAFT_947066 [Schizopora paradoxa]
MNATTSSPEELPQLIQDTALFVKTATILPFQYVFAPESVDATARDHPVIFGIVFTIVSACMFLFKVLPNTTITRKMKHFNPKPSIALLAPNPRLHPILRCLKPEIETIFFLWRVEYWLVRRTMRLTWKSIFWAIWLLGIAYQIATLIICVVVLLLVFVGVALSYSEERDAIFKTLHSGIRVFAPSFPTLPTRTL